MGLYLVYNPPFPPSLISCICSSPKLYISWRGKMNCCDKTALLRIRIRWIRKILASRIWIQGVKINQKLQKKKLTQIWTLGKRKIIKISSFLNGFRIWKFVFSSKNYLIRIHFLPCGSRIRIRIKIKRILSTAVNPSLFIDLWLTGC